VELWGNLYNTKQNLNSSIFFLYTFIRISISNLSLITEMCWEHASLVLGRERGSNDYLVSQGFGNIGVKGQNWE